MSVPSLDKLVEKRDCFCEGITSLKKGLEKEQDRLGEYNKQIILGDAGVEIEFDLHYMKTEKKVIEHNIKEIKKILVSDSQKLDEIKEELGAAKAILKAHGLCIGEGGHDWQIIEIFPMSGNWKKRKCRHCPTEERLGNG